MRKLGFPIRKYSSKIVVFYLLYVHILDMYGIMRDTYTHIKGC